MTTAMAGTETPPGNAIGRGIASQCRTGCPLSRMGARTGARARSTAGQEPPPALTSTTQRENGRNYQGYDNPRVDELFDRSRREFDRKKRKLQLQEAQALIYEDQPVLFLWNYTTTWAFSRRVRGVVLSPAGVQNFSPGPRSWWVPADESASAENR